MPRATTKTGATRTAKTETAVKRAVRAAKPATRRTRATRAAAAPAVTHEQIALRAYEIHLSGTGGDPVEHWLRAERELTTA
jgi:hypothetical protein